MGRGEGRPQARRRGLDQNWRWLHLGLAGYGRDQGKALHGWEVAREKITSGTYDLVILDEFTYLLDFGWLDTGDFIGIDGRLFKTNTGETTVEAHDITMLTKSLQPLPEKWHGLTDVEKRYRQRYLDLISNDDIQTIFRTRSRVISTMRRLLDERGYIEVATPILNPTAGGASARVCLAGFQAKRSQYQNSTRMFFISTYTIFCTRNMFLIKAQGIG